jgi:hypothetical protein
MAPAARAKQAGESRDEPVSGGVIDFGGRFWNPAQERASVRRTQQEGLAVIFAIGFALYVSGEEKIGRILMIVSGVLALIVSLLGVA